MFKERTRMSAKDTGAKEFLSNNERLADLLLSAPDEKSCIKNGLKPCNEKHNML